jgi:peroxiredoxin
MYCKVQLVQLEKDQETLRHAGLGLAAISYDSPAVLGNFAARKKITFPLLSDARSEIIRRYGVADRAYKKSDQLDLDTEKIYSGDTGMIPVYGLSYPAVFVIAPDGTIIWRFVSEAAEFRLTGAVVLERAFGLVTNAGESSVKVGDIRVEASSSNTSVSLGRRVIIGIRLTTGPGATAQKLSWEMGPSLNCWVAGEPEEETANSRRRELVIRPVIKASDPSVYEKFQKICLQDGRRVVVRATLRLEACANGKCSPESIPLEWRFDFVPPDLERAPEEIRRENANP